MIKKISILLILILIISTTVQVYASTSLSDIQSKGKNVLNPDTDPEVNNLLSSVIMMIQYAGTGIALIVVTLYGIKYMLASPADKADVKKQILPIMIGCGLLFATVNIVTVIAKMTGAIGEKLDG